MLVGLARRLGLVTNTRVFFTSALLSILFIVATVAFTDQVAETFSHLSQNLLDAFGWFYILGVTVFLIFLPVSGLVAEAASVIQLPFPQPSEAAFLAAGLVVVERRDLVVAIWDGAQARGLGGTADIVRYCRDTSTELEVVWPPGVSRD